VTAIGGLLTWPPMPPWGAATPSHTQVLIDAAGEKMCWYFQIPKTGTLDKAEFRLGTVTQAPINGIRVSFQGLDASGNPDGVQAQYRDVTTGLTGNTWIVPGLMTNDGTDTGVKRSVTAGDYIAVVVEFVNFAAGDSLNVASPAIAATTDVGFPGSALFTGTWTHVNTAYCGVALKYDDGTYGAIPCNYPVKAITTASVNLNTNPDEIGIRFRLPFGCKVAGILGRWARSAGHIPLYRLYDSDGSTILASAALDTDFGAANCYAALFGAPVSLQANTFYRATWLPQDATTLTTVNLDFNSAAILGCLPGGQDIHATQRTDGGAWGDNTLRRNQFHLLISDITSGGVPRSRSANAGGGLL
jgi:hypothetical protein